MIQWITGILAATLLLTTPAIPAPEACINGLRAARNGVGHICSFSECFVDENNDGICDNRGSYRGFGLRCRENFVDEDGDGVCDHRENHQGNFTDEDGDGVCDNRGQGHGKGNGRGCQRGKNK